MNNKTLGFGLTLAALLWLLLTAAGPLAAQGDGGPVAVGPEAAETSVAPNGTDPAAAGPETAETTVAPNGTAPTAAGPETAETTIAPSETDPIAVMPEAVEASPGFLRTDPAEVDADGNRRPSNWAGLKAQKLARRLNSPTCRGNFQGFTSFYPQGFANVVLDGLIESRAKADFDRQLDERRQGGFCERSGCGSAACGEWGSLKTFEVHRPSANYVSILYHDYRVIGGAKPTSAYEGDTYSLITGQPMTLLELFPQPQESVPKYWKMVYKQWCDNAGYKFPLHYREPEPCDQEDSLANPNTFTWAADLRDLGRLIFTPHGASLIMGPYEAGPKASRTVIMDFSKDELMAIGASPSIWGQ